MILRVEAHEQKRSLGRKAGEFGADAVVDFTLVIVVRHRVLAVSEFAGERKRRPDVVLECGRGGRGFCEGHGLRFFFFAGYDVAVAGGKMLPPVCDGEDGLGVLLLLGGVWGEEN